jgi:hypothetical protein
MAEINPQRGEKLKQDGIDKVLANNEKWRSDVSYIITQFIKKGKPFTAVDVRAAAVRCGLPEPSHPNAWGAQVNNFARKKLIVKTGVYLKSKMDTRHSGLVAEWVAA